MAATTVTRLRNFVSDKNSNIPITASYTDAELDQLVASLNCKVLAKATAPSSPTSGDTWIDTSTTPPQLKVYDGTNWNAAVLNYQASSVASATTTDIGAAIGSLVYITGTTTITGFGTVAAGTLKLVHFSGNLTLTYNATSMILKNNAANRSILAGDSGLYVSLGSGNWEEIAFQAVGGNTYVPSASNALAGSVIQTVNTTNTAVSTGTTVLPYDDSIPQSGEGVDLAVDRAITPNSASNKLKITVVANASSSNNAGNFTLALFQDATANALAAVQMTVGANANAGQSVVLIHYMTAGTTSATTFKARIGNDQAGTTTINGASGGRKYGGVCSSTMTIEEIKV